MKRLTVAAAVFAAGMLTIVAQSQAQADRDLFHNTVGKVAATDRKVAKPVAVLLSEEFKRLAGLAKTNTIKASKAKLRPKAKKSKAKELGVDLQKTASITRVRPNLKATARKSVKGLDSASAGATVASAAGYTTLVSRYAAAYGVPVSLAHAVISVESNYRPNIRGSAGEIGLMQIKPATARMMGYTGSTSGLFNPETNIKYGMKYLGHGAPAVGRHHLRHDPALQCRPCGAPHEPGFGCLLLEGEAASGRWPDGGLAISVAFFATNAFIALPAGRAAAPATAERLRVRKVRAPWKYGAG